MTSCSPDAHMVEVGCGSTANRTGGDMSTGFASIHDSHYTFLVLSFHYQSMIS